MGLAKNVENVLSRA